MAGPSFTVGSHTDLNALQTFLNSAKGEVRGKRDEATGSIKLYVASVPQQILDKVAGRSVQRMSLGGEGLKAELARFEYMQAPRGTLSETSTASLNALFGQIHAVIDRTATTGISSKSARGYLEAAAYVTRALPQQTQAAPNAAPLASQDMPLRSFGVKPDGPVLTRMAKSLAQTADGPLSNPSAHDLSASDDVDQLADRFGDDLARRFVANHETLSDRLTVALSDGASLKGELKAALHTLIAADPTAQHLDDAAIDAFVDRAVDRAACKVLPDQAVPGTATQIPSKATLPNIVVGGREYVPTRFLGAGGFADVYAFRTTSPPTREIAFKLSHDASPEARADVSQEIQAHRAAFGGSRDVIALEGTIRMPDGRLGIALEVAPNGDAHDMAVSISAAIDPSPDPAAGKISAAEAKILRLTMIKDMAAGLTHLHTRQQVTHYDFKAKNVILTTDGSAKIADFGLTVLGQATRLSEARTVDVPYYKAPELLRTEAVGRKIDDFATESDMAETQAIANRLKTLLPLANDAALQSIARNVMEPRTAEIRQQAAADREMLFFDNAVDVWGLGASALEMFTGAPPAFNRFMSQTEDKLTAFGSDRSNDPLGASGADGAPPQGTIGRLTGDADVDTLLRGLLRPDPRDRLQAGSIGGTAAMGTPGVGTPEAKALLVALHSGDATRIATARAALQVVTG